MRILVALCLVVGCTQPNPNVCCTTLEDCRMVGLPTTATCDPGRACVDHACVPLQCTSDGACTTAEAPFCVDGACRECDADRGCTSSLPRCELANNTCATCSVEADCEAFLDQPFCAASGACVECVVSDQCTSLEPVCDDNSCRACVTHDDCASNVCDAATGACIDGAKVLYASPDGSQIAPCTLAMPCSIIKAVSDSDALRPVVRALPGAYSNASNLQVMGLGTELTVFAEGVVPDVNNYGLQFFVGPGVRLHLIGGLVSVDSSGSLGSMIPTIDILNADIGGISTQFSTVTIKNSHVKIPTGSDRPIQFLGIAGAPNVTLRIERSTLEGTYFITANNAVVLLENSVMLNSRGDGESGPDTTIGVVQTSTSATFAATHTTFVNTKANVGQFRNCIFFQTGPAPTIGGTADVRNSIITPQGAQIGMNNTINVDPKFVSAIDFHLMADSPAIDLGAPSTVQFDFDGTPRPQGAANDVGAFEYKP